MWSVDEFFTKKIKLASMIDMKRMGPAVGFLEAEQCFSLCVCFSD